MNNPVFLSGLNKIYSRFDIFFVDLWGVVHNGVECYSNALKALKNIKKSKKIVLISNAPRPSNNVQRFLNKINFRKKFYNLLITSGDLTRFYLQNKSKNKSFYHLGPDRDKSLFINLGLKKTSLNKANFVVCTGINNNKDSLNKYSSILKKIKKKKLKMICANPDLIVHRGNQTEYCAGSIAKLYEKMGGKVKYFGKPYKYFYEYIAKAYLEKRIGPAIYEHYIPVFWTEIQISKRYDDTLANKVRTPDNDFLWKLWGLLSTMSKQRNYFTVVQHDDGITMSSKPANLITFAMGGVGNIPLPLTYNDTPEFNTYKNKDKTVFCSFVGSLTHPCREHMVRLLENKPGVFIVTNEWTNDIKEENQLLYLNVMSRSRFTLAPRGYGKTSFRLYEALRLGSIP
ncbi:MAG: TIGR01459 family HAD-type hydrolase, partial [Proteobacteria bacterium]|nr:TIGR01459 family HAD-type hydrolase [Pseudomonadota bacterium]